MTHQPRIVIITTPGGAKKDLANTLHQETNGAVALVIVQKEKRRPFFERFTRFIKKVPLRILPFEIYHFIEFKMNPRLREAIGFSKLRSPVTPSYPSLVPHSFETTNINADDVYAKIKEINPQLIVIWGGLIVQSRIISLARTAINMHHGYCPYYRGTNCYFHALLAGDLTHIGVTIHEATPIVDAGRIYTVIQADTSKKPTEFFCELNDIAFRTYVDTVKHLLHGDPLPLTNQDLSQGRNYLLKEWTYTKRSQVARILLSLEKRDSE